VDLIFIRHFSKKKEKRKLQPGGGKSQGNGAV
jgi:hypothetical protein